MLFTSDFIVNCFFARRGRWESSGPMSTPRQYLPHRRATSEAPNSLTLADRRSHGRRNSSKCLDVSVPKYL